MLEKYDLLFKTQQHGQNGQQEFEAIYGKPKKVQFEDDTTRYLQDLKTREYLKKQTFDA